MLTIGLVGADEDLVRGRRGDGLVPFAVGFEMADCAGRNCSDAQSFGSARLALLVGCILLLVWASVFTTSPRTTKAEILAVLGSVT